MPPRNQHQNQNRSDPRSKHCPFCPPKSVKGQPNLKGVEYIDYEDYAAVKPYIDYFGNIRAKYYTGVCLTHQKMLRIAVERARFLGMLAYRK